MPGGVAGDRSVLLAAPMPINEMIIRDIFGYTAHIATLKMENNCGDFC